MTEDLFYKCDLSNFRNYIVIYSRAENTRVFGVFHLHVIRLTSCSRCTVLFTQKHVHFKAFECFSVILLRSVYR